MNEPQQSECIPFVSRSSPCVYVCRSASQAACVPKSRKPLRATPPITIYPRQRAHSRQNLRHTTPHSCMQTLPPPHDQKMAPLLLRLLLLLLLLLLANGPSAGEITLVSMPKLPHTVCLCLCNKLLFLCNSLLSLCNKLICLCNSLLSRCNKLLSLCNNLLGRCNRLLCLCNRPLSRLLCRRHEHLRNHTRTRNRPQTRCRTKERARMHASRRV